MDNQDILKKLLIICHKIGHKGGSINSVTLDLNKN